VAYYKSLGVTVTRVMTDNGSCYPSFAFRDADEGGDSKLLFPSKEQTTQATPAGCA
jgi:hypothetical protein